MAPSSAIPMFYYALFGIYEPVLTMTGFLGALADPAKTFNGQAPWPGNTPPPGPISKAAIVTVIQLAHVCALVGLVNGFVLTAARRHLSHTPALQEKIVRALLIPLVLGDVMHVGVTLWALGDARWDTRGWSPLLWTTLVLGFSLLVPRVMWHMGIWRYVDSRDGVALDKKTKEL